MGTVSRLPEKVRIPVPIIRSEAEAFDGIHTLIRYLSPANAGSDHLMAQGRIAASLYPSIAGSGLLGITIPSEHGGADVSNIVLGEILISAASANRTAAASLASHFHGMELLRSSPATSLSDYFYNRALTGDLFMMVGTIDGLSPHDLRLTPEIGRPGFRLNGTMAACIDPIHADWIVLHIESDGGEQAAFIPRMTAGLRLTPEQVGFSNVHVDADCLVPIAGQTVSTAGPLDHLLQAAQRLGWAERELNDNVAAQARSPVQRRPIAADYLSALGLTVSRIESGKAALERAGRKIDTAQINSDADAVEKAGFYSAIALSSAAEAFDLATEIGSDHHSATWSGPDPYGHAPIGARLLEISVH